MLFLLILFVALIGYPYLSTVNANIHPAILTAGIFEGIATAAVVFYALLKLKGSTSSKMHNYSSPQGSKKEKPKKNPFLLKK